MPLNIDQTGWCADAVHIFSPNFDARPEGIDADLLVLHNISLPPGEYGGDAVAQLFTNTLDCSAHPYYAALADVRVSAHFLIRRDGELMQFVSGNARAWHAGLSVCEGRNHCNDFSIGIELEGSDDDVFENAQYNTLSALTSALAQRYPLTTVAGHSDIAPGRKTDPGPHFDWPRFLATAPASLRRIAALYLPQATNFF